MSIEEKSKQKIKIRTLQRSDRVSATRIFKTVIQKLGKSELFNLFSPAVNSGSTKEIDEEKFGLQIIGIAVDVLMASIELIEHDLEEWFASLVNMTIEEFNAAPLDIELEILEQLRTAPEAADFFTRCWQHARSTAWFGAVSQKVKSKLDSLSGSQPENLTD